MAKIGRPTIENAKTIVVKARITMKANEELQEYCKKHNLTVTDVIRLGLKKVLGETSD